MSRTSQDRPSPSWQNKVSAVMKHLFENGAIFTSRYPVISYGGDSQDQQSAETDDKKISQY